MDLGFRGDVVDFYHRYRRGYPPEVVDELVRAFDLTGDDVVLDLGCGTGQLALPLAGRVRAVVGVDPEPDMLSRARRTAVEQGVTNAGWMVGSDADVASFAAVLGPVGAVTIAQALHWMDHRTLFPALVPMLRPGGGVAVVTNGKPLWMQGSAWSQALRGYLEEWLGTTLRQQCGTDEASQHRYRDALAAAGFATSEVTVDYSDELTLDQIVGGVYSALSVDQLPSDDQRARFAEQLGEAVQPHAPFDEQVRVTIQIGTVG
jgi:SAM-dependent methyltransferase